MSGSSLISTRIVDSVVREDLTARQVQKEFMSIVESGTRFEIAGQGRGDPDLLFKKGLKPRHKISLFDTRYYISNVLQIPELRFMVVYVVQPKRRGSGYRSRQQRYEIAARLVYKDLSLSWRAASHFTLVDDVLWVGKGDVRDMVVDGEVLVVSDESTTDMPIEMQSALESLIKGAKPTSGGRGALELVLRRSMQDRVEPYRDFIAPREAARANPKNLINGGRSIARFKTANDPASLHVVKGFEPDFADGVISREKTKSRLYGGTLWRYRILSTNKKVQYYFYAGAKHVWLMPPQATTTDLSNYGVRTIDVLADDDLFLPGYEYHHYEETPNGRELYSQIPPGFAGDVCPFDEDKADASPWLDSIPMIQQFRRQVLKRKR